MKIRLLLILLVSSISGFSQKYAIIKGRLTPAEELFISWNKDPQVWTTDEMKIEPDKSGLFKIRVPIDKPTLIYFNRAYSKTLLVPGDTMQADIKNDNGWITITFTGKDSARFNLARTLVGRIERSYDVPNTSLSVIQNEYHKNLERYNRFVKLNKRHLRFKTIARVLISSSYYHNMLLYYVNDSLKQEIPIHVFSKMETDDLNEGDMIFFYKYLEFLFDLNRYYYTHGKGDTAAHELIENAKKKFVGPIHDALLFHTFRKLTTTAYELGNKTEVASLRLLLLKIFAHDAGKLPVINQLDKQYQSVRQPLAPEILKAKLLTDHGQQITIDAILRGHNKPLYLDFWASWCGACVEEMRESKKIYTEMNDKISFVYISIGDTEESWKTAIKKVKVNGIHLLLNYDQRRIFDTYFGIGAIPRYTIIDKAGRLMHPYAPPPSELESLKKVIDPLLSKRAVALSK